MESCPSGRRCSTRNLPRFRLFHPPVFLYFQGFCRVQKTEYFVVLTRHSNILFFPLFLRFRVFRSCLTYLETYRSGHNGTDSKSVVPHGTVGSNPTVSAMRSASEKLVDLFPFYGETADRFCSMGATMSCSMTAADCFFVAYCRCP